MWNNLDTSLNLILEKKGLKIRNVSITNNPIVMYPDLYDYEEDFEIKTDDQKYCYQPFQNDYLQIRNSKGEHIYETFDRIWPGTEENLLKNEDVYHNINLDFNVNI